MVSAPNSQVEGPGFDSVQCRNFLWINYWMLFWVKLNFFISYFSPRRAWLKSFGIFLFFVPITKKKKVSKAISSPKWCTSRSGRWHHSWRWSREDWATSTCAISKCFSTDPESIASTLKRRTPNTVSSKRRYTILNLRILWDSWDANIRLERFRSETTTWCCPDSMAKSSPGSKRSSYELTVHHNGQIPFMYHSRNTNSSSSSLRLCMLFFFWMLANLSK